MSRIPGNQPADGPPHPLRQAVGRPRLQSLLRYDIEDDPGSGAPLYESIVAQDTTQLTADGWLDRLDAIERTKARLDALEAETIAGFDDSLHGVSADLGHRNPEPGDRNATPGERRWIAGDLRSVADELALSLSMRRGHAMTRIHMSCELVHNFRATLHALREGWLTERAAFTIVRELSVLDDIDDIHAAEAAILNWAKTHPLVEIKQACQGEVARRSPAATDKRHQRAHEERSVRMYPDGDGRAALVHNQDTVDAAAVMTSLSRSAARHRRNGDPRTMDQLRADIALNRLLPRTKRTAHTTNEPATTNEAADVTAHEPADATDCQAADAADFEPMPEDRHGGNHSHDDANCDSSDGEAPLATEAPADEPVDDLDCEPFEDSAYEPVGDHSPADHPYDDLGCASEFGESAVRHYGGHQDHDAAITDPAPDSSPDRDLSIETDIVNEAGIGAEATVVIHATGAEVLALINGEVATGGEVDHRGPIPQSSLRKHLVNALAQRLLPNLPATPSSSRPGAATRRARTTHTHTHTHTHRGSTQAPTASRSTNPPPSDATRASAARIELRITDQPPPSDPNRYTPSAALDRYVRLRDRTCQFPGCNRPAEFTDLDHRIPFAAGGRTTAANLWCLCRHHHRLKHEGGWQIHPNPDGTYTWTSPTGRRYRNNPTDRHPPSIPSERQAPPTPTDQGPPPDPTRPPQPPAEDQ